jgi:hypothetical protein
MFKRYKKGTPVHVKSAINYNDLLVHFGDNKKYKFIFNGEKIKWVYLKRNELGIDVIAYKGHEDSPKVLDFIKKYIDYNKLYKQALHKKIMMLYESMNWDEPTDASKTMEKFF